MASKRYTFEVSDADLVDALEDADNRSELIREGVRRLVNDDAPETMGGLKESHRTAYEWLLGRGLVRLEEAQSTIAVQTQLDKRIVRAAILDPLSEMGLVKVMPSMEYVAVKAIPPVECVVCGDDVPPAEIGPHLNNEHAGDQNQ